MTINKKPRNIGRGGHKPPGVKKMSRKAGSWTDAQKVFVAEYLINMVAADAYRVAYPASVDYPPNRIGVLTSRLMMLPHIKEAIRRGIAKKEAVAAFKSDDVLQHLQTGVFLDPRPWFQPGNIREETWKIPKQDYIDLPVEIVRLIKFAEEETEYVPDPSDSDESGMMIQRPTGMMLVQLVSKELLLGLLAKHMLGEKITSTSTSVQINWDGMRAPTTVSMQKLKDMDPVAEELHQAIADAITPKSSLPLDSSDLASSPQRMPVPAQATSPSEAEPPKQVILSNLPLADDA